MTSSAIARIRTALRHTARSLRLAPPTSLSAVRLRQWTVLAMIIFAVLGAVTAYRGARTEQNTISIAEKLAQGQLIEVGERQRLLTQTASAAALWVRERAVGLEGQELAKTAIRAQEERRLEDAAWLHMRSQEEFAAARAIRLIREGFASHALSPEDVNQRVANILAGLGFGTFVRIEAPRSEAEKPGAPRCHESTGMELSRIWCETRERLETLHDHVRTSALAVAGFVLALTLFTVSDASAKARWRLLKWVFLVVGLLMGPISIAVPLVWGDTESWPWLLGGLIATPVVWLGLHYGVAFAERKGWVHLKRTEGSVHSEEVAYERVALRGPVLGHHIDHRFGIITIILIAVTVFVSAAVGWGYSVANTHADAAAEEARKSAAEMVIRNALFSSWQSELVRELAATTERRIRLGLANQRVQLSSFGETMKSSHHDEEARHADELRRYRGQFKDMDWTMDAANLNVEDDPNFPNRLVWQSLRIPMVDSPPTDDAQRKWRKDDERDQRSRNAYEAFAQSDLESSLSLSWRKVATSLLAALTIFAICLYFLGQALAMEPTRSGYVLLTAGIIFGCFGIGSSLVSLYPMVRLVGLAHAPPKMAAVPTDNKCPAVYSDFSEGPGRSRELAAYYYGIGIVLSTYNSDDDDLRKAERYFECALAFREDFAYARLKLAGVKSSLGSLDLKEPYSSLPMREKLQEIDLPEAQILLQRSGLDLSAIQRSGLAFRAALNGMIARDDEALVLAESAIQETLDLVKAGKMLANPDALGTLHFNLGLVRLARGRFDDGIKSYREGMEAELENALRVSALTDLEIVTMLRCKDEKAAKGAKFDCAGLLSATVEIKKAVLGMHTASKLPSPVRNLPREDFTVSATANHLLARVRGLDPESDDLWLVWSRLERSWNSWRTLQSVSLPIKAPRKGSDTVTIRNGAIEVQYSFVRSYSGTKECLEEGHYRAELYSHGTLVAARPMDRPPLKTKTARFPELNVQLCVPSGWNIVLEKAAAAEQRTNYGVIRGFRNAAGAPAAFVFNLYLPTSSDGLASCLVPKNAINCAVGMLIGAKLISGNEPRLDFEDRAARSGPIDNRTLIYRTWTTSDGGVHVIIAKADSGSADQLREVLESAEVIYGENNIETAAQK